MREQVEAVVRDVVRPLVEADGGTIEVVQVDDDAVVVRLGGAYAGCPSAPFTLRRVVEPAIRKATGKDTQVRLAPGTPAVAQSR